MYMLDKSPNNRPTAEECINKLKAIEVQETKFQAKKIKIPNIAEETRHSITTLPIIIKHTKSRSTITNFLINNEKIIKCESKLTIFDLK